MTREEEFQENKSAVLTVTGNPETKEDPGPQLTVQLLHPSRNLVLRETQINDWERASAASATVATWTGSIPAQAATVAALFFLSHAPLTAIAPHTSPGQPHFTSSEYLWMLFGVHIPLWGRLPGMGLPILSPRSCLSGIPALHPTAVCIPQCLAATGGAGVVEKNERAKNSTGAERAKRSSTDG